MEVQVARIHSESLGELSVRQLPFAVLAEHLQDPNAQRVAERLQLLRLVEYQRLLQPAPSSRPPSWHFYI